MKIYYKSKIAKLFTFIDGYKTIMLFGAVFTERDSISLRAEYHEVDCMTYAKDTSLYSNNSFFVFV